MAPSLLDPACIASKPQRRIAASARCPSDAVHAIRALIPAAIIAVLVMVEKANFVRIVAGSEAVIGTDADSGRVGRIRVPRSATA